MMIISPMLIKITFILLLLHSFVFSQKLVFSAVEDSRMQKNSSQILKHAYAQIGIKTETLFLPPERALKLSNSGINDGEVARVKRISKQYTNLYMVPEKLYTIEIALFTHHKRVQVSSWKALKDYKIAILKGVKIVEQKTQGMNIKVVTKLKAALDLVLSHKVDIAVLPKKMVTDFIKKPRYKEIQVLKPSLLKLNLYHFLHKKHKNLIPKITHSLQKIKEGNKL